MAAPPSPSISRGDASPPPLPSHSSKHNRLPLHKRFWSFSLAKPVKNASNGTPQQTTRVPYVPTHAASDFILSTTPKLQTTSHLYKRGDDGSMEDFSLFISQAKALDLERTRRQRSRNTPKEEALPQTRNRGGVVRRIADYVKPPRDG